jgi:undecaprenyl-diphosphatase
VDLYHYLQIVLLGIVEGVTEFLPISSTGHLLIAEHLLGTQEPDIFNVVIQAGAILAVVFIYWKKLVDLFMTINEPASRDYLIKIGLAFLVTMALVLVLTVKLKIKLPESLTPVAWATLLGGFVIFGVEAFVKNREGHDSVSWLEATLVGAGQVIAAMFPGASRSGSTIMLGLSVGMKRPSVTQFSFLVGIPTMFAASVYATFKSYKAGELHGVGHQLIIDTVIGFIVSGIVAFFVVKWLLRFVQSHTFNGFAIYRVILGGGLLLGLYTHAIPDITNEEAPEKTPTPLVAPAKTTTIEPAAPAQAVEYATNAATGQAAPIPVMDPSSPATMQPASALPVPPPPATNTAPAAAPATP